MLKYIVLVSIVLVTVEAVSVCYPPYGCFSSDAPFNQALVQLPESPQQIETKFYYFTRNHSVTAEWLNPLAPKSPSRVKFDASKTTVFFTHGYIESRQQWYMQMFIDELLKHEDMNIILCEWSKGSSFPYHQAAGNARLVGAQMAYMIEVIRNDTGINLEKLHLVGFSLGSHVVGHAGKFLKKKGIIVPRITGLDPAAPYFEYEHIDVRLDTTDADFVDVIHTDTKTLIVNGFGAVKQLGHLDFYPNGGYHQLGCGKFDIGVVQYLACSHYRAVRYFIESINSGCPFYGYPCDKFEKFQKNQCMKCEDGGCPRMGYHASKPTNITNQKYFLTTHYDFPYCGFHYKVTFKTGDKYFADYDGKVTLELLGSKGVERITLPSHNYEAGSTETLSILLKTDIGDLKSLKVTHDSILDIWYLIGVSVKTFESNTVYSACFNRWFNNAKNKVDFYPNMEVSGCVGK